jgi:AraC family transcriptional regulator, transcriptional activator of pobA
MDGIFNIIKITSALSAVYANAPAEPHRHNYEEIIIVASGEPVHFIDFNKASIAAPGVIYIAQGKIHQFLPDKYTTGWAIRYKNEFIPESKFHFYSNFEDNTNYTLQTAGCLQKLDTLCAMMLEENAASPPDLTLIKHLLAALLAKLETEGRQRFKKASKAVGTQPESFNNFLKILEQNYQRPEGVQFYADKLNMSVRNLNLVCRSVFNKSVSEIIETRKLIEARRLLMSSALSVSEIGYSLGYNEKTYFSRVFHKKTGLTPTAFREKMQQLLA